MFGPVSEGMRLFKRNSKVAIVGYSENPKRVTQKITQYLLSEGNHVTGINPNLTGESCQIPIKPSLAKLDEAVDIIQVFRNSLALAELADEILELSWQPQIVWCQQGVVDMLFQERLEEAGLPVVMDACPYALRSYL